MDNENYSLTMAESYVKDAPSDHAAGVSSSASGTKVVSLGRTRLQRAKAQNTSRSSSNISGSASIRITRSQSAKECEISGSKSVKEPEVDVSQNNIKLTKKRRRHSKLFLKLSSSDRPILGSNFNSEIVSNLKTKLSATQLELFKSTCFGYLLNLPSIKLQTQLIYYLLTKEVEKEKANEMTFVVNGVKLRFGLAEFACVSGLKCTDDVQLCSEAMQKNNPSIAKYFMNYPSVSKEHLVDCVLTKIFESDEDAIKIAVLFVVNSFLFSIKSTKLVDRKYLDLVDKGDYNRYTWGIDVYEETVRTMSGILDKQRQYYWISGFPYAIQIWFYECFEYLHSSVASRCENTSPAILRWSVTQQLKFEELNDKLYGLPSEKLNLRNMSLENEITDNVNEKQVSSDDDFVDHPPETLKRQCKMMINVNSKRKRIPSNVLGKKGKDDNSLKKRGKAANEISKMKTNNDLVDYTSGKGKLKNETGNDLEKKVVENIHNQHRSIGKASVEPPTKYSEWYVQFKILQDGQDELKKEVSSLKKEYKEELVVLKNYLAEKFVEVFNAINSIKKSTLEHDQNGDVKKDVQASGFVDVGFQDEDEWLKMCDVEAHKLTAEYCKQTRNEDVPTSEVYKKSSTKMIPNHEIEMTDAQIDCQIHKITSEFVNKSIGVAPITTFPKYSTHEEAATSSFAIQSSFEGVKVYEILDDSTEEDATRMKKPLVPCVIVKGDHPFKISITEEIPVSIRDDFNKFVQSKLIQTRR
ncbi:hypothetical protein A4A49_40580 [Nicotiana attenuata]|uniref:DUF1985 domain-containing protein n=1 Tax=Nicotiana attenuata TaxID=49451 RepID=A0A1J6KK02_NICAT|nr:hypothetical protein A4A49_40580 [Nicotiana attenuata]